MQVERLEQEKEEANRDAEMYGAAFDRCYEDYQRAKDEIEVLKTVISELHERLCWLQLKLGDVREESYGEPEEYGDNEDQLTDNGENEITDYEDEFMHEVDA